MRSGPVERDGRLYWIGDDGEEYPYASNRTMHHHKPRCYHNRCSPEEQKLHNCGPEATRHTGLEPDHCFDCDSILYMVEARMKRGQRIEVTEDDFHYMLNVLPPIYAKGCLGISEAYTHDEQNRAERIWFAERKGKYLCFYGIRAEAELEFGRN